MKEWAKAYRKRNRAKIAVYKDSWSKRQVVAAQAGDPKALRWIIKRRVAALMRKRLRKRKAGKGTSVFSILPYTSEELMFHLESKFLAGMSWANMHLWHIDHIYPDSSFQYTSIHDEGFKQSWALSNLQPLWALDNMYKRDRMPDQFVAAMASQDLVSA